MRASIVNNSLPAFGLPENLVPLQMRVRCLLRCLKMSEGCVTGKWNAARGGAAGTFRAAAGAVAGCWRVSLVALDKSLWAHESSGSVLASNQQQ